MSGSTSLPVTRPKTAPSIAKSTLWVAMALATLSVLFFFELRVFLPIEPYRILHAHLASERVPLFPHILFGLTALLAGPFQFSSRLRRSSLQLHRVLGRIYVCSVFISAAFALYMSFARQDMVWTWVHALVWAGCTVAALLLARNRQIVQHRQWMIRSYAVTFSFILVRILKPWPAYRNMTPIHNGFTVVIITFLCVCLPDVAFNWRELTHRRG